MNRRGFLRGLGGLAALSAMPARRAQADGTSARRPNVVIIFTDDHDLDEIGCYGGKVLTPHMDSLARDGMKFDRFYVASAVCAPSRFNILSGRYASRAWSIQKRYPPPGPITIGWEPGVYGEKDTLAHRLKAAGYVTGMAGKWHQGGGAGANLPGHGDPRDPKVKQQLRQNYETLATAVKSAGFDYAGSIYGNNVDDRGDGRGLYWLPKALQAHNMEWVTQGSLDFIEQNKDKPFFLYMAPTLVHSPDNRASLNSDPGITPLGFLDEAPKCQPSRASVLERCKKAGVSLKTAGSTWLDDGVGAVLKKLDEFKLAENTLVWLIGDNGNQAKFTCYEGGARMPAVARWPGVIPAGQVCKALATSVDVAPTILSLCGGTPAAATPMDGQDITAALKGEPYGRESVFLEITSERAVVTGDGFKYMAVRHLPEAEKRIAGGEKLNHWCRPLSDHTYGADKMIPAYFDRDQLYDLKKDPAERKNLVKAPEQQERLANLKELLRAYCAKLPHSFGEFTAKAGNP